MPIRRLFFALLLMECCVYADWPARRAAIADEPSPNGLATVTDGELPPPLKAYKGREIAVTMHYEGAPG